VVHLVLHVERELLLEVKLGLAEPSSDRDERGGEDPLDAGEGHKVLDVGREPEVDRVVVV
jgi:hypothetical protein